MANFSPLIDELIEALRCLPGVGPKSAQRISFLTTPEEVGRWAWHCHLAFHMDAGMFREVAVV